MKKVISGLSREYKYIPIVLPILILAALIYRYSVNVPVTDQYEMIPLFQKLDHGTLTFANLWAQHNEHRILFPSTYLLILARLTHWNIRAELISSFFIALGSFSALLLMLKRMKLTPLTTVCVAVAISFLFFSPIQQENWLWGWQIEWFMCIAAVLWSIYFLSKITQRIDKYFITAICFAIFASYCLASGLLIWVAGLLALLILKASNKQYAVWSFAGAIATFLYYWHYINPPGEPSKKVFIHQPINFVKYFVAYIGAPVSSNAYIASIVGMIILITAAACTYVLFKNKRLLKKYVVWLTLGFYIFLAGVVTAVGRLGLGLGGALSSRYTTFSVLFLISTIVILVGLLREKKLIIKSSVSAVSTLCVVMGVVGILVISSYYSGLQGMKTRSILYRYIKSCSQVEVPSHTCLYQIYFPSTTIALSRLNYLKQKHYAGY